MAGKPITHEQFLEALEDRQPLIFSQCTFNDTYITNRVKMSVTCNECGTTADRLPRTLLSGHGCKQCTILNSRTNAEQFFNKLFALYPDYQRKYDYSGSVIDGSKCTLTYKCNDCGNSITQHRLDYHLSGRECSGCTGRMFNKADLIRQSFEKFGDKFDFTVTEDFVGRMTPIKITCDLHGIIETTPARHLKSKLGCGKCARYDVERFKEFFYSDPKNVGVTMPFVEYELTCRTNDGKAKRFVTLDCEKHGRSVIRPCAILKGSGCPKCAHGNLTGIYNTTTLERNKDKLLAKTNGIYLMKLTSDSVDCYKLGIAKNPVKRAKDIKKETGFKVDILYYGTGNSYDTITLEQTLLKDSKDYKYTSPIRFGGHTELLTLTDEECSDLIELLSYSTEQVSFET